MFKASKEPHKIKQSCQAQDQRQFFKNKIIITVRNVTSNQRTAKELAEGCEARGKRLEQLKTK